MIGNMAEFDDVMQPPHFRPQLEYNPVTVIDRYTVLLKDEEPQLRFIRCIHSMSCRRDYWRFSVMNSTWRSNEGIRFLF